MLLYYRTLPCILKSALTGGSLTARPSHSIVKEGEKQTNFVGSNSRRFHVFPYLVVLINDDSLDSES